MAPIDKETCLKELHVAGDLEKETELLQTEATTAGIGITWETPFLSLYCC